MFLFGAKISEPYISMIEELTAEKPGTYWYNFKLKDLAVGRKLLDAGPEEQRAFALAAAEWLERNGGQSFDSAPWMVCTAMLTLLRRRLPLDHDDVVALLDWSLRGQHNYWRGVPQ